MSSTITSERIRVVDYVEVPGIGIRLPRIRYAYLLHTNKKQDPKYLDKSDINQEKPPCQNPDRH